MLVVLGQLTSWLLVDWISPVADYLLADDTNIYFVWLVCMRHYDAHRTKPDARTAAPQKLRERSAN